jgi:hypothetical protein
MSNTNQMETANGVTSSYESNPYSSRTLIEEINEMRASNSTNTPEFVAKMRELEILLGVSQISPFGTNELEVFQESLAGMSLSEIQKLAQKVGLNPFHDYPTLKKNLLKEFSASTRNSRRNIMPTSMNSFVMDPNNPEHKHLMKIINDI